MERPYLFAGDRGIAVRAFSIALHRQVPALALYVSTLEAATRADELEELLRATGGQHVIPGAELREPATGGTPSAGHAGLSRGSSHVARDERSGRSVRDAVPEGAGTR